MKNNIFYKIFFIIIIYLFNFSSGHSEQFNFNIKEIEVIENGNIYKGSKGGSIETDNGVIIYANVFVYNKLKNTIEASGKVRINDTINKYIIFSDKAIYQRNEEVVTAEGNSKIIDSENREITAKLITYKKIPNTIEASGKVRINDTINKYIIFSDKAIYQRNEEVVTAEGNSKIIDSENREITAKLITYKKIPNTIEASGKVRILENSENYEIYSEKITLYKNEENVITKGYTEAYIEKKYNIKSENVIYKLKLNEISSKAKSTITDNNNQIYFLDQFIFYSNEDVLKGKGILTLTNYNSPKSDKFYFSEGVFNLKTRSFTAKDTKINIHKNIFDESDNDPRIYSVSSKGDEKKTLLNKGIFTSCQFKDGCAPWSIKSSKILHDKDKKELSYENAILNIYDVPVFYFPKFFHPDPSVKKQSGFLKPAINQSDILGSSFSQPYYKNISKNKDFTISPTWFDKGHISIQNEYRQANKNSNFLADFGIVKGYKSPTTKEKNNLSHLFLKYDLNLDLDDFNLSELSFSTEQVTNDTYLKVFDNHITNSKARPDNLNSMKTEAKLVLNNDTFNFDAGFLAYEDLSVNIESDRYQYILPYYNYSTVLDKNYFNGSIAINSSGSNNLKNTNNLKSNIINDFNYNSNDYITDFGLRNDLNILFKNVNSVGKNDTNYKSSPDIELLGIFEANTSLPLINKQKNYNNYLTPKLSFRFNPTDMKNYSDSSKKISTSNIFSLNRLGLEDSFESGRSLTLGLDYKKASNHIEDINRYFEVKLATTIRDKEEKLIPKTSTIGRKNSNLFGSIRNNLNDNMELNYNFAVDNDLNTFEYNEFNTKFIFSSFETNFNFIEENGEMGDSNIFENSISYNIDDNNLLTFKTRRNRKINLTEYYDLVYEYKSDCMTAGIKYKKSYYSDRDLKPTENLLFTITLFPITTNEYDADDLLN